jgi:hypothetical protein
LNDFLYTDAPNAADKLIDGDALGKLKTILKEAGTTRDRPCRPLLKEDAMQWDKIMEAAKRLEDLLRRADVDFNEAQKAIGYYLFKGCDDYGDGAIP